MKSETTKKDNDTDLIIARRAAREISLEEMNKVSGGIAHFITDTGLKTGDDMEPV